MNLILFSSKKKNGVNQFSLLDRATPASGIRSSNEHNWVGPPELSTQKEKHIQFPKHCVKCLHF